MKPPIKCLLFLFLFAPFFQWSNLAFSQNNVGFSYLGVCHPEWPCEEGINAYKDFQELNYSFLYDRTFGDDCSCIRKMYKDPRKKITRIHLTNGPGLRNRRLQKEEVFFGYSVSSAGKAILQEDQKLKEKFQEVAARAAKDYEESVGTNRLLVSTCLECDFRSEARKKLVEWAKPFFPKAGFVDNPLHDKCMPNFICEKHGDNATMEAPCIADLDGEDFQKVDLKSFTAKNSACLASFIWGYKFNLLAQSPHRFIPPRERSEIPNADYFRSVQINQK